MNTSTSFAQKKYSRLACHSRHHSHIHVILAQFYPFLEEYWKSNAISCTVAIMVFTDTSDDECTIALLNPFTNPGLNTSVNSRYVCCSIIPLRSPITNKYVEIHKTS